VMRAMAPCIVKELFARFDGGLCHAVHESGGERRER
jgi:hypothetical protein